MKEIIKTLWNRIKPGKRIKRELPVVHVHTFKTGERLYTYRPEDYGKISSRYYRNIQEATNYLQTFSLAKNENAQNYFDNQSTQRTIQYEKLIPVVTEKLLDYNSNPKGNPYTGQDQIVANKFIINKVKILNHRWIIADFSDGEIWGEVLLKYFVNEDETISFEVNQSLLYQK